MCTPNNGALQGVMGGFALCAYFCIASTIDPLLQEKLLTARPHPLRMHTSGFAVFNLGS
jgi:hypothetical protein